MSDRRKKVEIQQQDVMHLMPVVWHQQTGIVLPNVNPQVNIRREGENVTSLSPWPMLSQSMGFHIGDNVQLPKEGSYQVEVSVGKGSNRRTRSLADAGSASFEFSMEYSTVKIGSLSYCRRKGDNILSLHQKAFGGRTLRKCMVSPLDTRRLLQESAPIAVILLFWVILSSIVRPTIAAGLLRAGVIMALLYTVVRGVTIARTHSPISHPDDLKEILRENVRIALPAGVWFLAAHLVYFTE